MASDARVRYTKMVITQSFIKLLGKKPINRITVKDLLTFIMVNFKAEEETYKVLCSANGDPAFPAKIFEACHDIALSESVLNGKNLSTEQKEWAYCFAANGCNGILNQWIAGGMNEPISEVADFAEKLINNALVNLK